MSFSREPKVSEEETTAGNNSDKETETTVQSGNDTGKDSESTTQSGNNINKDKETTTVAVHNGTQATTVANTSSEATSNDTKTVTQAKKVKLKWKKHKKLSKNKVKLAWKKAKNITGVVIYVMNAKKGKFKVLKTIKSNKKTTYTVKKLKKNKTYYFKLRAYKVINGKKVYGKYSKVKKIKM